MKTASSTLERELNSPKTQRRRKFRHLSDGVTRYGIAAGGIGVIVAISLIFFYLLYEVVPLFQDAEIEEVNQYGLQTSQATGQTLRLVAEEQNEVFARITDTGQVNFVSVASGTPLETLKLPLDEGQSLTSISPTLPGDEVLVLGLSDGQVLLIEFSFNVEFDAEGNRIGVDPEMTFPYGEDTLTLDPEGRALTSVTRQTGRTGFILGGLVEGGEPLLKKVTTRENMMTGEVELTEQTADLPGNRLYQQLLFSEDHIYTYAARADGWMDVFNTRKLQEPELMQEVMLVAPGEEVTDLRFQLGSDSLLVGDSQGQISQWMLTRNAQDEHQLTNIRTLKLGDAPIRVIEPEHRRKGLVAVDENGRVGIYNTTAENEVIDRQLLEAAPRAAAISPRASHLLLEDVNGKMHSYAVDNPHPEASMKALWGKTWYEGYDEPEYIWQSSGASNDYEPKFSITPLALGTLKAAFYAMLLSVPLAICGAMYTAYFMAPAVRKKVKPVIELMEALPTVILGFFAGLFLAPFFELHLPGIFALMILMPVGLVAFGYAWAQLPDNLRFIVPDGWHVILLLPVVLLIGWFSFAMSQPLEVFFFGGDMRTWLTNDMGITYDQRNSIVVGFAMGFAVIPTIYSIAEDALFGVPKSLSHGSLALGATAWQTLVRVILPTASPGIFSAVMIGMGRAVGETMIVLMATGNTPVMNFNIFEGMRTLAANIAVEMGESAVDSSHYRILFLAALVLFGFTFFVNTLAELVRQRLRKKYSTL
ncbi:ABC transporter permease subunit [Marinospirillum sp.]|uniref:ABC transporter permease subunit n=1 Tax=Marinospirillum sp. TaxID=2183934 RepID=UPI00286FB23B|nr:ABC transporter permease subunit [Marinospirillum sp.]MDR9466797.1 ABC transporter permease subunit [Marinospirillum sp.]